jgi:hypothetical protein
MKRFGLVVWALSVVGCYNPALPPVGFYCDPNGPGPSCPDGSQCLMIGSSYRCVVTSSDAGVNTETLIPKSQFYSGPTMDPMLATADLCPDKELEPNDDTGHAIDTSGAVPPIPDMPTAKITHMAICPTGPNPATGNHDVDYYKVDTTSFGLSSLTMMSEIFYDVSYGDLDIGIFDSQGKLLAADATAVTNGCCVASVGSGVYYVVVVGAKNMDSNRYDIRIRTFSTTHTCPTAQPPPDMAF